MAPDDRIRELAGQLLRAESIEVIDTVASELHHAIDQYVALAKEKSSVYVVQPSPLESPA